MNKHIIDSLLIFWLVFFIKISLEYNPVKFESHTQKVSFFQENVPENAICKKKQKKTNYIFNNMMDLKM